MRLFKIVQCDSASAARILLAQKKFLASYFASLRPAFAEAAPRRQALREKNICVLYGSQDRDPLAFPADKRKSDKRENAIEKKDFEAELITIKKQRRKNAEHVTKHR